MTNHLGIWLLIGSITSQSLFLLLHLRARGQQDSQLQTYRGGVLGSSALVLLSIVLILI
jgi:hypothetical protein